MAPTYKQWTTELDGVDKLKMGEAPMPGDLQQGEVLVKIRAVSLNYRDIEVVSGDYAHHQSLTQSSSLVPCSDMAGVIVSSKSSRFQEGDRVLSIFNQTHIKGQVKESDMASGLGFPLSGVLAEYRVFDGEGLVKCPDYLSDEEASTLPIAAVTAWMSINTFNPLGQYLDVSASSDTKKPTLLVQGTGGVSVAGLQIARAAGLNTIVTSSSDEKLARATKDLGAGTTVNYRTHWEWQEAVMKATDGAGADIIFETGGAKTLRKSFDCIAFGGLISCIGYLSGKEDGSDEVNRLNINVLALRRNVTLKGMLNGPRERFEEMLDFYAKKGIKPVVSKTFTFDEAKDAFAFVRDGQHFGKVVIKVST
ncbi:uncharacterized protein F5Z01DRAFT_497320 [Emericellopsis atlantica]|uniref:Enoyl reductase (ER) domain-containing protein n=1 Tax=Emericellopsis atlantica TaxID=2614577 RepID=A0A9P7ZR69_9HYPO|nr:uncharacterized protein F5Z01DRAFT_497320 [Emericellopsis atlantica]KAG9256190.1 hypothetical protein F5Z01DRAFT_497320 [Emericellopsis atlantica]